MIKNVLPMLNRRSGNHRESCFARRWLFAIALSVIALFSGVVLAGLDAQGEPISVARWSGEVWSNATAGRPSAVLQNFDQLPADGEVSDPDVKQMSEEAGLLRTHLEAQLVTRIKDYDDAIAKLEDHINKEDYRKALADALSAHEVSLAPKEFPASLSGAARLPHQDRVLRDPRIVNLMARVEAAAKAAEASGDWLTAQDYFYRLNALMNTNQRYEKDLKRTSRRVQLLSMYVPARLRDLTNAYLTKIGEKPRPARPADEQSSWQNAVAGIDRPMVIEALSAAARDHLWAKGWDPLIEGGLESIRTVLTTTDLQLVFPMMKDDEARKAMLDQVDAEEQAWKKSPEHDRFTAYTVIRHLQDKNKETVRLPDEVLLREFVEGSIAHLDKFSSMIWPDEMAMFNRQLSGSYVGVGIQISLDDAFQLKVVSPLEDSPAMRAGIRAGDVITAVDGVGTMGISLTRAVDTITGKPGTPVTLTIKRPGVEKEFDVTVRRQAIKIETIKGWRRKEASKSWDFMIDHDNKVGYIRLVQQFGPSTVSDFDRAMMELQQQGVRSLILDLRFNPGGLLNQAVELCNRFIDEGLIVETVDPDGRSDRFTARRHRASALLTMPVIVLINEGSASASEIVSGCLKDHHRALLIGTRTYGKGSVQKIRRIAGDRARLRLTSEHYLLPSGKSIHRRPGATEWGVDPDLLVRMTPKEVADTILLREECDIIFDPKAGAPANGIVVQPSNDDKDGADGAGGAGKDNPEVGGSEKNTKNIDRNPDRLIEESGYDLQLETALVILQAKALPDEARQAVLSGE